MSRFSTYGNETRPVAGGANLTVMVKVENDFNLLAQLTGIALERALKALERADRELRESEIFFSTYRLLNRYFLTGPSRIAPQDLATILTVIAKTRTGLSGDVTIKTGPLVGKGNKDVGGAVTRKIAASTKPYHTQVARMDDGEVFRRGAIRIDEEKLTDWRGVVTLVHEATHKYAGTIDYCYFKADGSEPDGVFNDKAKALMNADRYGYFIAKLGKA
jgi:hypothetical protein